MHRPATRVTARVTARGAPAPPRAALELAVQDGAGVAVAAEVGADRVELCTALALGGLTPSPALIDRAVAAGTPVHVLVRPRAGGFVHDATERDLVVADVAHAVAAGAAGVVVGPTRTTAAGHVPDLDVLAAVVDAAAGAQVTFHRAFDVLTDRRAALDVLAAAGVCRVLTAGGASRAVDGLAELAALVRHTDGAVEIMAGGGVDAGNAARLLAVGVAAVHSSARRTVVDDVAVALGSASAAGSVGYETVDRAAARALRAAVDASRAQPGSASPDERVGDGTGEA